jgi:exopolyphosphatase/guanosine-5'-triphosphate,3'-diphosphate pyrophosphatase
MVDVGSNSVHLQVVDAMAGGPPLPTFGAKWPIRLAVHVDDARCILPKGRAALLRALEEALEAARAQCVDELLVFATSTLRDAPNGDDIRQDIEQRLGIEVSLLTGDDEARFTFLAARRWFGWHAGHLLVLDIGGGSMEIAHGRDEHPDLTVSLPLGAARVSRDGLTGDRAKPAHVERLRHDARAMLRQPAERLRWEAPAAMAVATSSTFRRLARLTGAPRRRAGPFAHRELERRALRRAVKQLAGSTVAERAQLPGVSRARAAQILGGAIVAEAAMTELGLASVTICPWALREGILLQRLDALTDREAVHARRLVDAAVVDLGDGDGMRRTA